MEPIRADEGDCDGAAALGIDSQRWAQQMIVVDEEEPLVQDSACQAPQAVGRRQDNVGAARNAHISFVLDSGLKREEQPAAGIRK